MPHPDQIEFYNCPICGVGIGNDIDGTVEHKCKEEKEYIASFQTNDMTTLPQKLEAIRAVCVKANPGPERKWNDENSDGFDIELPVLLSDVLAAMKDYAVDSDGQFLKRYIMKETGLNAYTYTKVFWNLLRPSLDEQEEATVNLIYEILCA